MNKQGNLTGWLLILAALTFWISWYLMPDPGTVDTVRILNMVKEDRVAVLYSVIIQIISSMLYVLALFFLIRQINPGKTTMAGAVLLGIGTLGLCSDAFFHLLAWFMTDNSVTIQADVIRVMDFMQTDGVTFLLPILLPFFAGNLILAIGLNRQKIVSKNPQFILITALLVGVLSEVVVSKIIGYRIPGVMLVVLGLFAVAQVLIGLKFLKFKMHKVIA